MKIKWSELTPSERDALVAKKVMGAVPWGLFQPSTDISAAWQVVEKMKKSKHENSFNTIIEDNFYLTQITPEYICKAALKAVGVEIE